MKSLQFSNEREAIIAENIREVVAELRLVDPADYIAFIRCELFANIADIVASATELYFFPVRLNWAMVANFTATGSAPLHRSRHGVPQQGCLCLFPADAFRQDGER